MPGRSAPSTAWASVVSPLRIAAEAGTEQHVRAVLDQRHQAQLRKSALASARPRHAELGAVLLGVGHVQAAAIQAGQPPTSIPRPLAGGSSNRLHQLLVEPAQGRLSEPAARL